MKRQVISFNISDVHEGHPNTPASRISNEIITLLTSEFEKHKNELDTDRILFIGGDFFDRLINMSQQESTDIDKSIFNILRLCKKYDVSIRVLKGTPSHDWEQNQRFVLINDEASIGVDLKYFDKLSIEYNDKSDIYVLYVPDEWEDDPDETLKQVHDLLIANNISKVDIAIMHGNFKYQLPEVARAPKHDERSYLDIVKYYISIGHIHTHSIYDRIYAQGSFSRLSHGEEESKGMVKVIMSPDGSFKAKFVENKLATIYKTIDVSELPINDSFIKVRDTVVDIPDQSHIRLVGEKNNPIFADRTPFMRHRPNIKWSFKQVKTDEETTMVKSFIDEVIEYRPMIIDNKTVVGQLEPYLSSKLEGEDLIRSKKLLQEMINELL